MQVLRDNLLAHKIHSADIGCRHIPSSPHNRDYYCATPQSQVADQTPASLRRNPGGRDKDSQDQTDRPFGKNRHRDSHIEQHPPGGEPLGDRDEFEKGQLQKKGQRGIDARAGSRLQKLKSGGENNCAKQRRDVIE